MRIELLSLGMDGVIFDTEDAHLASCNGAFESCGLSLRWSISQFRRAARLWGAAGAITALAGNLTSSAARMETAHLLDEKSRLFHEIATNGGIKRHPGCMQLIEDAMESGCKLAVVTDIPSQTAAVLLEQAFGGKLIDVFAVVASGVSFDAPSDNGPYHLVLRTVGMDAHRSTAIEASSPGIQAAQQAGMWAVAATPTDDIDDVSGADLWCPQLQKPAHFIGKESGWGNGGSRFITFEELNALKASQYMDLSALRLATSAATSL